MARSRRVSSARFTNRRPQRKRVWTRDIDSFAPDTTLAYFKVGTNWEDQTGDRFPIGSTYAGGHLELRYRAPSDTPADNMRTMFWGLIRIDEAFTADNITPDFGPFSQPHADWLAFGSLTAVGPDGFTQTQPGCPIRIKSKRYLDENQHVYMVTEVPATGGALGYSLSSLFLLA